MEVSEVVISIVIPAYNYAEKLPRAINSVLGQLDLSKHELIVINDGSTDHTKKVLSELKNTSEKSFEVIHQENSGSAAVRNLGIKLAKGSYLIFRR